MRSSLPLPVAATRADSLSLSCLLAAIDASGHARKVYAADLGLTEQDFSKALSTQRFDLRWLDAMPPVVVLDFLTRYANAKFSAYLRLPEPADLLARVLAQVNGLVAEVRNVKTLAELRAGREGAA